MERELLLVDGNSLTSAAFFGIPPLNAPDGTPTNAVKGFIMSFFALMDNFPTHVGVVFDKRAPLLRKHNDPNYKADRTPMQDELAVQYPVIQHFLKCLNVPMFSDDGYEADDIIASFVGKFYNQIHIRIATRDRDLLQLCGASPNVCVHLMRSGGHFHVYNASNVHEVYGVHADQIALFKALAGDSSDGIPGIPKIGPKSAVEIIQAAETYEGLLEQIEEKTLPGKYLTKLAGRESDLERCYKLASFILRPIRIGLEAFERRPANEAALQAFYEHYAIHV